MEHYEKKISFLGENIQTIRKHRGMKPVSYTHLDVYKRQHRNLRVQIVQEKNAYLIKFTKMIRKINIIFQQRKQI